MPQKQKHNGYRLAGLPIKLAILFSLGIVGLPAAVLAQTQVLTEEDLSKDEETLMLSDNLPTHVIPHPCPNGVPWQRVCGSDATLLRIINKGTDVPQKRVSFLRPSGNLYNEVDPDIHMSVVPGQNNHSITFQITISKTFLRGLYPIEDGEVPPTDITPYGVSIFGQLGPNTCYWDCSYVNSIKKCQCIEL
jgi:hypothetical protein